MIVLRSWTDQWELIDGIPYAMSPLPTPKHQRIANNLGAEFRQALKKCNSSCTAYQPLDYKIADDTVVQPDVLIVCGEIEKPYLDFPPALVAEILSPSTFLKDRHTKYGLYQTQGVRYYLIIDIDVEEVEVYELVNHQYALQQKGKDILFALQIDTCQSTVHFANIWD